MAVGRTDCERLDVLQTGKYGMNLNVLMLTVAVLAVASSSYAEPHAMILVAHRYHLTATGCSPIEPVSMVRLGVYETRQACRSERQRVEALVRDRFDIGDGCPPLDSGGDVTHQGVFNAVCLPAPDHTPYQTVVVE